MADRHEAVQQVLVAWQASPELVRLGAQGILARVESKENMTRGDVCQNVSALMPIVRHLGTQTALVAFLLWGGRVG